jgi:phenylalanyl-tRNA synthetase alpha chain
MPVTLLSPAALARDLSIPDLTDPAHGPHAVNLVAAEVTAALAAAWGCPARVVRGHPVVPLEHNYDRLGYPPDTVTLDARYTRYVSETCVLRGHTTAIVPRALRVLGSGPEALLACPGICYRRDAVDRLHTGAPHQLDLWRLRRGAPLGERDLVEMIGLVLAAALPGARWRTVPTGHPYTDAGRQVDALVGSEWVEVGECGLAAGHVLRGSGLATPPWSGLAMGLGLDRLAMLRKGVPDIRLLRSADPRVAAQMRDLAPYRPVSTRPPVRRDLSVAVAGDADGETLGDRVREALGDEADVAESVTILADTPYAEVPAAARDRLGLRPGQRNLLVRVVLRPYDRTLTDAEANALRDRVYSALHETPKRLDRALRGHDPTA